MSRPHPYTVEPYVALQSPLLDYLKGHSRFGFASVIEPSAREQLAAARSSHATLEGCLDWVWKTWRGKPRRSNPKWKPYHRGEAKPPLTGRVDSLDLGPRGIANGGSKISDIRHKLGARNKQSAVSGGATPVRK